MTVATASRAAYPYPYRTVTLVGHGWGHGRGMGQWGALGYALSGTGYEAILAHYYGGTAPGSFAGIPIRVVLQEVDNQSFAVTSASPFTVAGIAFAAGTAARFVYLGAPGQWAIDKGPSCGGRWRQLATAIDPTATPSDQSPSAGPDSVLQLCLPGTNKWLRGTIQAYDDGGRTRAVNTLPLELYLEGVVPAESPAYWGQIGAPGPQGEPWGFQELEAQAVAARSYAVSELGQYGYADICDQGCQAYGGQKAETALTDLAVHDTAGQVRFLGSGSVARTEYSASTGGYTAGGTFPAVPDLGDSVCVQSACNQNHVWRVQLPVSSIEAAYPEIGALDTVTVTARNGLGDLGGRVESMTISGSSGSVQVTGDQFASAFNLRSNWFAVTSAATGGVGGYWVADAGGDVFAYGDAQSFGSPSGSHLPGLIVAMAAAPSGRGYWLATAGGAVYSYGSAQFFGSLAGARVPAPIVAMVATRDARGYWLVGADGSVYTFGDARFWGSLPRSGVVTGAVVGMAGTGDGRGYWLVTADGTVYPFGDARTFGSLSPARHGSPIVGFAATADRLGYWLLGADGSVYAFGDALQEGTFASAGIVATAVTMSPAPTGRGYLVATSVGSIENFGDAPQFGDPTMTAPSYSGKVVAIVVRP